MEADIDPPAKNTRSNQKVPYLSPTRENKPELAKKKLQLTPIPQSHLRTNSVDRQRSRPTAGERANELLIEHRRASRSLSQCHRGQSKGTKSIILSNATLEKLKQFKSPTYDSRWRKIDTKADPVETSKKCEVAATDKQEASVDVSIHSILTDNSFASCCDQLQAEASDLKFEGPNKAVTKADIKGLSLTSDSDSEIIFAKGINTSNKMSGVESFSESENSNDHEEQRSENEALSEKEERDLPKLPEDATASERVMYEMLKLLETRMAYMEKSINKSNKVTRKTARKGREVEKRINKVEEDVQQKDLKVSEQLLKVTQVLQHQQAEIDDLKAQLEETNYKLTQDVISISGIPERPHEHTMQLVRNFFSQILDIKGPIDILAAHRVGEEQQGMDRSIRIKLGNPGHKGLIFQNISNLKGKENEKGGNFQINDHVTGDKAETLKRNREVIKANKKITTAEKLIMTTKKGKIYVDEQPLNSLIHCPSRASILKLDLQHLEDYKRLMDEKTTEGPTQTVDNSTFKGYSMEATSVDEINEVYIALRAAHMDANHIVCAFRIPGRKVAVLQHYHDDGEIGEGRKLLHLLREADIYNRAVFVVRQYQYQIGGVRHVAYRNAVSAVITTSSFNSIRNETQVPWPMEEIKSKEEYKKTRRE